MKIMLVGFLVTISVSVAAFADFPVGSKEWAEEQGRQQREENARLEAENQAEMKKWKKEQEQDALAVKKAEQQKNIQAAKRKHELAPVREIVEKESIRCPMLSGAKPIIRENVTLATADGGTGEGFAKSCVKEVNGNPVNHGKHLVWYPSGKKAAESEFDNGVLHGTSIEYNEDGSKRREMNFKNGRQHGKTTVWGTDGLYVESNFENGKQEGKEIGQEKAHSWVSEYSHGIRVKHEVKRRTPASQ